jgi:hypothetical protein
MQGNWIGVGGKARRVPRRNDKKAPRSIGERAPRLIGRKTPRRVERKVPRRRMSLRVAAAFAATAFVAPCFAQTDALQGFCTRGGQSVTVSGLSSTNKFQNVIPHCQVTVYLTGTNIKATLYRDNTSTPLTNPFTADALTSLTPGRWLFFAATGQGYDVIGSGGDAPNVYPQPVVLGTDLKVGGTGGGGSGCTTSGQAGTLQAADGTGGCQPAYVAVNSTSLTDTTAPNFIDSSTVTFTNPSTNQIAAAAASTLNIQAEDITLGGLFAPGFNQTLDFNSSLPAAPAGGVNATFQTDPTTGRVSAYVPSASLSAQLRMNPGEDATHIFLPFTQCIFTTNNSSLTATGSGCDALGGYFASYKGGLFNHNVSAQMDWSLPQALPSWLPAGNVTGVQIVAYSSGQGGASGTCGGSGSCPPNWLYPPFTTQKATTVTGVTGATLSSLTARASQSQSVYCSSCASPFTITGSFTVEQVGLLVQFSGVTNPNPSTAINVNWPVFYRHSDNSIGISDTYPYTIAPVLTSLLTTPAVPNGSVVWTSDNTTVAVGDICTGSGTAGSDYALCISSAGGYTLLADFGGPGFGVLDINSSDSSLIISPTVGHVDAIINPAHHNTWTTQQTFNNSRLELLGLNSPVNARGGDGASGNCFISLGAGNTPIWQACPGTVGPGTVGYIPSFATTTTIGNSHIDDGVTTAGHITFTEPADMNSAGPSQWAFTYNATPLVPGGSTDAVVGVDSSGNFVASEAGAAASRVCTAGNGVCGSGSGTVTTTGTPASGNLTKFSGASSITNGDLSGDVTTSGALATTIANNAVTTAKINNSAVTLAKIQNAAANSKLLGSGASGSGSPYAEITLGANLSMSGTTLSATSSGGALNGTVIYTSSQTASTSDNGKLVVFNCSTTCNYTLPASQPSTTWQAWVMSIGATTATILLGGGDTFNGGATAPTINNFRVLDLWADSATATNYYGQAPYGAGSGIVITPAASGTTIALATALPNGTTATTQSAADNSTKVATTAYVDTKTRQWSCQPGLGDGLNAVTAGTYLESTCYNTTGVTITLTGLSCFTDNSGSSTMNASGNTLGALLTGAVTCTSSFAAGTQSANVALTSGDYIKFTFVADGTSKQTTWVVKGTY